MHGTRPKISALFLFFTTLFISLEAQGLQSWIKGLKEIGSDSIYQLRKNELDQATVTKDTLALALWAKKLAVNQFQLLRDYPLAISTNKQAAEWASKAGDQDLQSACLNNQGIFLMSIGRYDDAIQAYKESLAITQQQNDSQSLAKGFHNLGNLYLKREQYPEARPYFLSAFNINSQLDNGTSARKNLLSLGVSYSKEIRWDSAKYFYLKALKVVAPADPVNKGLLYTQLGHVYNETYRSDSALFYFKQALKLAKSYDRPEEILAIKHAIGNWHFRQDEYQEAIQIWEAALDSFGSNSSTTTIYLYGGLAMTYKKIGQVPTSRSFYQKTIESCLRWGNVREAATYRLSLAKLEFQENNFEEAQVLLQKNLSQPWIKEDLYRYTKTRLELALIAQKQGRNAQAKRELDSLIQPLEKFQSWTDLIVIYDALAGIAEQDKDYNQMRDYLSQKARWQDSIRSKSYNENLAKVRAEYEYELQQSEITRLETEQKLLQASIEQGNQRRQLLTLILVILTLAASIVIGLSWRISRQSRRISSQRDKLKLSNKNKDRMFAIIAHDLSSPVNSFQDLNRLYQYHLRNDNRQALDALSSEVSKQSSQLGTLLNNLLQWALQQLGTYKAELTRENLEEIVHEQANLFKGRMQEKNISLSLDLSPRLYWRGDIKGFRISLNNLLSNAVKFSENATIRLLLGLQGEKILLMVEDQGLGMQQSQVDAILKGKNYHSSKGSQGERGAGFGLQFVWQWLKQIDGKMVVESSPGEGSCIGFLLPINERTRQHESA